MNFEIPIVIVDMLRYSVAILSPIGIIACLSLHRYGHAVALAFLFMFMVALLNPDWLGRGPRVVLFYFPTILFSVIPIWHALRR